MSGASGYVAEQKLRERCAGACSASDVDSVRTRYRIADVGLGVGAVAGIAAAAVWLWAPERREEPAATLALGPGSVSVQGAF